MLYCIKLPATSPIFLSYRLSDFYSAQKLTVCRLTTRKTSGCVTNLFGDICRHRISTPEAYSLQSESASDSTMFPTRLSECEGALDPVMETRGPAMESPDSIGSLLVRQPQKTSIIGGLFSYMLGPLLAIPPWVKASESLLHSSAAERKALCVNQKGELQLMESGYMVVSHVWGQGIQSDESGRGFAREQLAGIFHAVKGTGAEWLWLDAISIPSGDENEYWRTAIINTLSHVYKRADAVIILEADALVFPDATITSAANCLARGTWMKRLWTYSEVKLAKKALVVTRDRTFEYSAIVDNLGALSAQRGGQLTELHRVFAHLVRRDDQEISLSDIIISCQGRVTGDEVDYARALFPVLGMVWQADWSREDGISAICNSPKYRSQAGSLVMMNGCPRLSVNPRWAPSYLTRLRGPETFGLSVEDKGLRGTWLTTSIVSLNHSSITDGFQSLALDVPAGSSTITGQFLLSEGETQETVDGFLAAVRAGRAFVLSSEKHRATALLAAQSAQAQDELTLFFTAGVRSLGGPYVVVRRSWLISNQNPSGYDTPAGDLSLGERATEASSGSGVQLELEEGKQAARDDRGETPPFSPIAHGRAQITPEEKGWTQLHTAAAYGRVQDIRLLLGLGVDIEARTQDNHTALLLAAENNQIAALKLLLENSADPNVWAGGYSLIHKAAAGGGGEAVQYVLGLGFSPSSKSRRGWTPLHTAAKFSHAAVVDLLIRAGADLNPVTEGVQATPLHIAAEKGSATVIAALLSAGADPNPKLADYGWTPLYYGAEAGNEEIVGLLIRGGADVNACSDDQTRPLHLAATSGNLNVVSSLLTAGADVHVATSVAGDTPLHIAAKAGNFDMVKLLLASGASPGVVNNRQVTALDMALGNGYEMVAAALLAGWDPVNPRQSSNEAL